VIVSLTVVVDYDLCQSHGQCMIRCPEVFEVRNDGFMYVLAEHPDESLRDKLEDAVAACPTQAISLQD
jgi:ferredoxin